MSKRNRIPVRPVCCASRARRRVRVARWRRLAGAGRPVPPVPVEPSTAPRCLFGLRRASFYALSAAAYGLLALWWFAPVFAAGVVVAAGLLAGWRLLARLFSYRRTGS